MFLKSSQKKSEILHGVTLEVLLVVDSGVAAEALVLDDTEELEQL
jgi:hypothetical protein